jgi:hypothetical protein
MGLRGRFFSTRDLKVINSFNGEIMGDIIQTTIILYKMEADQTKTNIYGETDASTGKMFFPGVEITALIDKADIDTPYDEFGPDRNQTVVFKMRENMLKLINIYPEVGDIVKFNNQFFEVDNVVQQQFLGGIEDKSFSIIINTHYSRLSKLNFVERQQ